VTEAGGQKPQQPWQARRLASRACAHAREE
jgi:hypothetical protein